MEVIPGAVATQHSGEGKANQYFLRGFNLDHGTDFSASIDGVPINNRTHGHGQGYLDLNFMIPEIVEQVRYRKGPYHADTGDFSAAGSAAFSTYDGCRRISRSCALASSAMCAALRRARSICRRRRRCSWRARARPLTGRGCWTSDLQEVQRHGEADA